MKVGRYTKVTFERDIYAGDSFAPLPKGVIDIGQILNEASYDSSDYRILRTELRALSSQIKVKYKFESSGSSVKGTIKLYNISDETKLFILQGYGGIKQTKITIDAGYRDNHGVIVKCYIADLKEYRNKEDFITELTLGSVSRRADDSTVSISVDYGKRLYDVIIEELDRAHIVYEDNLKEEIEAKQNEITNNLLGTGFAFHGTLTELLDEWLSKIVYIDKGVGFVLRTSPVTNSLVVSAGDIRFAEYYYHETGKLVLKWNNEKKEIKRATEVNASTGLIKVPTVASNKGTNLEIEHILIPQLTRGSHIRLELSGIYSTTKRTVRSGDYTIMKVKYNGSNYEGKHTVVLSLGRLEGGVTINE